MITKDEAWLNTEKALDDRETYHTVETRQELARCIAVYCDTCVEEAVKPLLEALDETVTVIEHARRWRLGLNGTDAGESTRAVYRKAEAQACAALGIRGRR